MFHWLLTFFSTLGTINIGLTCKDVSSFKFHSIICISRVIDEAIGNKIPSDLVSYKFLRNYLLLNLYISEFFITFQLFILLAVLKQTCVVKLFLKILTKIKVNLI